MASQLKARTQFMTILEVWRPAHLLRTFQPSLYEQVKAGKSILFEGTPRVFFLISTMVLALCDLISCTAGVALPVWASAPKQITGVLGITKAYATRVNGGPFPTELKDEAGALLARKGDEFGATTGRPRRCGWFDAVAARYACRLNGVDLLVLTKPDVLEGLSEIKACL